MMGFICYWGFQKAFKNLSETFKDSSPLEHKKRSLICRNGWVEKLKRQKSKEGGKRGTHELQCA